MIPDVKTVKEIQDPKKTDSEKETADKDEKSETKRLNQTLARIVVCHYG